MATVTCHTPDCLNADVPIEIDLTFVDDDGVEQTIATVVCGVCGQQITDIQQTEEATP